MKQRSLVSVSKGVLKIVDIDIPSYGEYEMLVRNEGCIFCNTTDKMIVDELFDTPDYPTLLGHENFGIVQAIGAKVKNFKVGDRVICANPIPKGYDGKYYSTWGGFSEYGIAGDLDAYLEDHGTLDEANKYKEKWIEQCIIPRDFSYKKAGLVYPMSECASAIMQVGDLKGKRVVVIGTGIVGYTFVFCAKQMGAKEVICMGRRQSRLDVATKLGADNTYIEIQDVVEHLSDYGGADVVFECSGNYKVFEKGLPYIKDGGVLACYAVPHKPYEIDLLKFPTNYTYKRIDPQIRNSIKWVCSILAEDKVPVDTFVTHVWDFEQAIDGYNAVLRGEVIKGLVVIAPEGTVK